NERWYAPTWGRSRPSSQDLTPVSCPRVTVRRWHRRCKRNRRKTDALGQSSAGGCANDIRRTGWRGPTRTCTVTCGGAMATPLPERPRAGRPAPARPPRRVAVVAAPAAQETTPHNWALYAFLFLLPLQNIQKGYLPKLPGGINFLNVGFLLALIGAWRMRGHISRWSSVHRWVWLYVFWSIVTLWIGLWFYPNPGSSRVNDLKDSMLGVLLLFVVEMSVTNWFNLKRVILFMLLPRPYILRVTWAQHASVAGWHYKDDLRLNGTFALLGANEFASFCVTMALMLFALLLAGGLPKIWRALLVGGIVCMSLGVLWAYSRTAYVAILMGAAVIVLLWRGRWKMVIPIVLVIAL